MTKTSSSLFSFLFDEVPAIPLFQPYLNLATQSNVTGYRYLFHRQLDYRYFAKI